MTEHLPECVASVVRMKYDGTYCICPDLRACEERMLNDDIPAAAYHGQKGYQIGYIAGLDAAVQRVEALLFPWPNTWPGMIRRGDVIIAIRGES